MKPYEKMREEREWHIPEDATEIPDEHSDAVVYTFERENYSGKGEPVKYVAVMFCGRRKKPDSRHWYGSAENRAKAIENHFAARRATLEYKQETREERKVQKRGLEIGDIVQTGWGYNQTQREFFEVVDLYGKFGVVIRQIASKMLPTEGYGSMAGKCKPVPGKYIGEPMRKMSKDGMVKIYSFAYASKTDPETEHYVSWGH